MATTTYLSQPAEITFAGTDVTDQVSAITFTLGYEPLTATAFGDTGSRMVKGLQTVEGTITMFAAYGATEPEGLIAGEIGAGDTTIVVKKDAGAISATNPEWTLSNVMIANNANTYTVGELQVYEVSFEGGTWVRDVTP